MEFPAWFDINLDRRLSVQFDGDVDDMASFEKTLRRSIRPSAGQIDTHRATAPDDLVGMDREPGFPFPSGRRADDGFTEQAERLSFVGVGLSGLFLLYGLGPEHQVVHPNQRGFLFGQFRGKG